MSNPHLAGNYKNSNNNGTVYLPFPAHDELGTCRATLISPEQPVLCIPGWLVLLHFLLLVQLALHLFCSFFKVQLLVYAVLGKQ